MTLVDARGVEIAPGDTVIYPYEYLGLGVAEGVVLGNDAETPSSVYPSKVSLTPSGRVRIRVVRRSAGGGEKPVVDVAPDRLVVLKTKGDGIRVARRPLLPPSPLPTQAEERRKRIENLIEACTTDLRATEVPDRHYYEDWTLAEFHAYVSRRLASLRKDLKALDG